MLDLARTRSAAEALQEAAGLFDSARPPGTADGVHPEYIRGVTELLARMYGIGETDLIAQHVAAAIGLPDPYRAAAL